MQIYFWHIDALKVLALSSEYVNVDLFRDFFYQEDDKHACKHSL